MLRKLGTAVLIATSLASSGQGRDAKKAAQQVAATAPADNTDYRAMGAPLPAFRIVTAKQRSITDTIAASSGNFFLMLFNPTCEHCEEMTRRLGEAGDLFRKSRIVLAAAPSMMPYLEFFQNTTHYNKYPKLQVGIDSSGLIDKTYGYYSLPQINIYNTDRKLIRRFSGETPIDSLKPYIQ